MEFIPITLKNNKRRMKNKTNKLMKLKKNNKLYRMMKLIN